MDQDLRKSDASRAAEAPVAASTQRSGPTSANALMNGTVRLIRRAFIALIGGTVVLIGAIMLVTPGPAVVVIPAGLAILAIEFEFARRWLRAAKERASAVARQMQNSTSKGP